MLTKLIWLLSFISIQARVVDARLLQTNQSNIWQPSVNEKFQIILEGVLDISQGTDSAIDVFDLDLFYTPQSTIETLHANGKRVICYFSAGTSEDWRPDYSDIKESDKGNCLAGWSGERWVDIRKDSVFDIMKNRIILASRKGCDAVDPDNMDAFSNTNGLGLTSNDSVNYMHRLAAEAVKNGLSIGLKNAESILYDVKDVIHFVVNESCASYTGNCTQYIGFDKPIYHIEYGENRNITQEERDNFCLVGKDGFSHVQTIIKTMDLNGWATFCDKTEKITATIGDGVQKGKHQCRTDSPVSPKAFESLSAAAASASTVTTKAAWASSLMLHV